jgi:hypothetical protein
MLVETYTRRTRGAQLIFPPPLSAIPLRRVRRGVSRTSEEIPAASACPISAAILMLNALLDILPSNSFFMVAMLWLY